MEGNNKDIETRVDSLTDNEVKENENSATEVVEEDMVIITNSKPAKLAPPIKQYGIAVVIILIMGLVLWYGLEKQGRIKTEVFDQIGSLIKTESPVAVVNGVKISKTQYEKNREQIIASAGQQGLDITDEKVKSEIDAQAIDVLVNTELLRQAAKEAGVEVTPEQVEGRYQEVITSVGGDEELAKRMTELGITETSLRNDIEGEILIQSYLTEAVDTSGVTVEELEITTAYKNAGGADAGLPPLADVHTQIEDQLKSVKEQELITAFIQTLKDKATIEVMI